MAARVTVLAAERKLSWRPWKFWFRLELSCGHFQERRFKHGYQLPTSVRAACWPQQEAWKGESWVCVVC